MHIHLFILFAYRSGEIPFKNKFLSFIGLLCQLPLLLLIIYHYLVKVEHTRLKIEAVATLLVIK